MKKSIICFTILLGLYTSAFAATITGTVTYEKLVNSAESDSGLQEENFIALYGAKVSIFNDGSSTELATTKTGSDGSFSLEATPSGDYTIVVYSQNEHIEVGSSVSSTPITTGIYTKSSSGLSGTGPHSIAISMDDDSGAFNILHQMERGIRYIENLGYSIPSVLRVKWPDTSGSYFEPENYTMGILGVASDPDEWDDDVILHEFGHAVAESISIDHSLGGYHSLSGRHDMRLAWSEGLATYIGSAIQGDPYYRDSNGSGETGGSSSFSINYDITNPESNQKETTNEVAISYVLYQAGQLSGDDTVFSTLASYNNNSSKVNAEQATMDTFHDLWAGSDLSTYYDDRDFSYKLDDQLNNNVSDNALTLNETTLTDLTFYPDGASDFFKHIGSIQDVLSIDTSNSKNGALTSLTLYRKNGSTLTEVASNDQANGAQSDDTSSLEYTLDSTATYIIEVSRFNSSSQNYGLGASSGYSQTAGTYGSYDLTFSYVRTNPITTSVYDLDSSSDDSTIENVLESLLSSYESVNLTSKLKAFGNVSVADTQRSFSNTDSSNGTTNLSVINSTGTSTVYTVSDDELPLTITNIPDGITAVVSLLPVAYESEIHELSREKLVTIDLLNGSDLYTGSVDLDISFTSANISTRIHQLMKQGSSSFAISDDLLSVSSDDIEANITETGVYSLRQLVNANATSTDKQAQLSSFISNNNIGDLFDELAYFHHLVDSNGDQASVGYNSTTNIMVAKSSDTTDEFADTFYADGNVSVSGIPEDLVLVMTSLPKSYATSVPDNAENQIYFFNMISDGVTINQGFTLDVDFLDQGRSDFDYYLHKYDGSDFEFLSQINNTSPNLNYNLTSDGTYLVSANLNSANATTSTVTFLVSNLLTTSVLELSKSTQFASLLSVGNISTASDGTYITLQTITSENTVVTHSDEDTALEISGIPQGNTIMIVTIPSSQDVNAPANSASDIVLFNLYDSNSEAVTSGFTIPVTFVDAFDSTASSQSLFRLDEDDGSYDEINFNTSISGDNITFNMTSFSSYVLNNEPASSSSSSGGGGGGGGCLLR